MDGITFASKKSISSYSYVAYGGISNTIPWVAGLYALCCEVNIAMTPEFFWEGVEKTASRNSNGLLMINPKGLIEYISQTSYVKETGESGTLPLIIQSRR